MSVWIGDTKEAQGWLSVLGQLFAPATLRDDLSTLNAWIDALLAFLQPYGTGTITTNEPRVYRTTPHDRGELTQALSDNRVNRLVFGVADPNMPCEYQGVTYNGPHVLIYFNITQEREVVGLTISLAPLLSPYQAALVTHLPTFLAEWVSRLNVYEAYVAGGDASNDTRRVMDYFACDGLFRLGCRAPDKRSVDV